MGDWGCEDGVKVRQALAARPESVLKRLGEVGGADGRSLVKVRDGAGDLEHSVVRPCGQLQGVYGLSEELAATAIGRGAQLANSSSAQPGVWPPGASRSALDLCGPGPHHSRQHIGRRLGLVAPAQLLPGHPPHPHLQIDAIEQGPAQPTSIPGDVVGRALAAAVALV